jgi:hypothetical protein
MELKRLADISQCICRTSLGAVSMSALGQTQTCKYRSGDLSTCVWVKEVAIHRRANLTRSRRVREVANGAISVAPGLGR